MCWLSLRCFAPLLPVLLILQGVKESSANSSVSTAGQDETHLKKCCSLGNSWADRKLRCESFVGPVSGVSDSEQASCLEAAGICCRKSFQEQSCEEGKTRARAGLACSDESTSDRRIDDYRLDCCDGCKLGILTGSSGKGCALSRANNKLSLGMPWEPAFMECCIEASSTTIRDGSSSSSQGTLASVATATESIQFESVAENEIVFDLDITGPIEAVTVNTDDSISTVINTATATTPSSSEPVLPILTFNILSASAKPRSIRSLPVEDNELNQSCPEGFRFSSESSMCDDVNECAESRNICPQAGTVCINTQGSYECKRLKEYQAGESQDSSRDAANQVANQAASQATSQVGRERSERRRGQVDYVSIEEEGRDMSCVYGFTYNTPLKRCHDIDECQVLIQPCAPGEMCRNTQGGYDCVPAACPRGFLLVVGSCQDVDECAEGIHACAPHERCQNSNGSFTCEQPRSTRAPYVSERPGIQCRKGYKVDTKIDSCVDIDECLEGPGCRDHERCQNLQGTYDCSPLCDPGWYFDIPSKKCQDVDECLLGHHSCRQRTQYCRNTNGSYACEPLSACPPGYRRAPDGSCADVDECQEGLHACSRDSYRYCVNLEGSYECITRLPSCPRGYEYSLLTRQCEDVDECRTGRALCNSRFSERCVNLRGSYRCERPALDLRQQQRRRPACPEGLAYDSELRRCNQPSPADPAVASVSNPTLNPGAAPAPTPSPTPTPTSQS